MKLDRLDVLCGNRIMPEYEIKLEEEKTMLVEITLNSVDDDNVLKISSTDQQEAIEISMPEKNDIRINIEELRLALVKICAKRI